MPTIDRAVVVLQRAGDDLRGRGGVAVDEHRRAGSSARSGRPVAQSVSAAASRPRVVTITPCADEHARDELRLGDEAAAVVAQVEHDPLDVLRAAAPRASAATSAWMPWTSNVGRYDHADASRRRTAVDRVRRRSAVEISWRVSGERAACARPRVTRERRPPCRRGRGSGSMRALSSRRSRASGPSTAVITSPARIPAARGRRARRSRSARAGRRGPRSTSMPTPENCVRRRVVEARCRPSGVW